MSGKGGGGANNGARKGNNGTLDIPAGSRKMVQSLKDIVSCPGAEIYAMLKECNMDPYEAVNRLLSQDPFHEAKSKREKKKENKDTTDSRPRGASNTSNRGCRSGFDRYGGQGGATHFSSNEDGNFRGKPANKRQNGTLAYEDSASFVGNAARQLPPNSESVAAENKMMPIGLGNAIPSSQPSAHQPAWSGAPGQRSMVDIVKMGRPNNKISSVPNLPHENVNLDSEIKNDHEVYAKQQVPFKEEWPTIERPIAPSTLSALKAPTEAELCAGTSALQSHLDEVHVAENGPVETLEADQVHPSSISVRNVQENDSRVSSPLDDNMFKNADSYQTQSHFIEENEDEDNTSSVTANLRQLSIENRDGKASHEEYRPGVIIPNHLQVHAPECSHLSFGSFEGFGSRPLSSNLKEASEVYPSADLSGTRKTEFYGDERDGSKVVANASTVNHDSSSESQTGMLKQENAVTAQANQYAFSSSEPGYGYENTQQLNTAFDTPQTSSQMQNIASFGAVMKGSANSIPSTLLAQTIQSARELDHRYSPFPLTQSMPMTNNNTTSLSGPNISMPEALKASSISAPQPVAPGDGVATGPALAQHLAMHPYSQPTLPVTHFANMIGYPLLPQSYPYMPSAFQQPFAGSGWYHQSLAAMLPQYKNSLSVSSLPQSASGVASGYVFGNSSSVGVGNFPVNQQVGPTGTTIGYEDVLSSKYKDANHMLLLLQNENSPMWLRSPGSRTTSAVPARTYYNISEQQHQQARQAQQQPPQHYGSLGHPIFYQSQTGLSLDHQQQSPRDSGSLGGSQVQAPSQQAQQIW